MKNRLMIVLLCALGLGIFMFGTAGATSSFNFDQCANDNINGVAPGPCDFIGSNAQGTKAAFWDGMAVPQRIMFNNITPVVGAGDVHTMTFALQWTKSSVHAYDFLVSWAQARQLSSLIAGLTMTTGYSQTNPTANDPCQNLSNSGQHPTDYERCLAIHSATGYHIDVTIPHDPFQSSNCDPGQCFVQDKETYFESVFGPRTFPIWGDAPFTGANMTLYHSTSGSCTDQVITNNDNGDTYLCFTVVYTSASTIVDAEVAPHIGLGCDSNQPTQLFWGCTHGGASAVSGSPYHFSNPQLDGVGGSQDNQIQVSNTPPVGHMLTSSHNTQLALGQSITDTVQITGATTLAGGIQFFVCGPTGSNTPCLTGTGLTPTSTVSTSPSTIISPSYTPPSTGTYCFRVQFTSSNSSNESTNSWTTSGITLTGGTNSECFTVSTSTAVVLSSFKAATPSPGTITLNWATGSEVNTAGFNIYRAENADGPYVRINAQLIPASTNAVTGASYEYQDTSAVLPGKTYYYQLEDVELNGKSVRHPAISVTVTSTAGKSNAGGVLIGLGLGMLAIAGAGVLILRKKMRAA